jgi:V8-like Glu-specific endopeptidase
MSQVEINNLAPPYNTVAYLEATFADGNVFIGSGVMVGPNDVLTASHVVYSSVNGGVATSVKVILGYDPSPLETPYGTLSARSPITTRDSTRTMTGFYLAATTAQVFKGRNLTMRW